MRGRSSVSRSEIELNQVTFIYCVSQDGSMRSAGKHSEDDLIRAFHP